MNGIKIGEVMNKIFYLKIVGWIITITLVISIPVLGKSDKSGPDITR